ncbi:MAG: hypothetical protein E5X52_34960 [Mesorhizobium sp.]|nr:MAG: hypothetical protein E5X52_34960 [Mesorhizobium sp.]
MIVETAFKYDDAPRRAWSDPRDTSPFSNRELDEIEENVELLLAEETTDEEQSYRFESCRVQHCRSSLADNYSCWN